MELHVRTRASLRPDPEFDPILALFYYIHNDWPLPSSGMGGGRGEDNTRLGIIAIDVDNCGFGTSRNSSPMKTEAVKGEKSPTKGTLHSKADTNHSPSQLPSLLFQQNVQLCLSPLVLMTYPSRRSVATSMGVPW